MSFTVRFKKTGFAPPDDVFYAFATPTPFLSVVRRGEFTEFQPPQLVAILATFTIEGILYGTESSLITDWGILKAKIETPSSYPDGLELVKDPSTVVESLAGYDEFKVEVLEAPQTDLQWRNEIRFKIKVSAKKRFGLGGTLPGNLSAYDAVHSWSYDETGLATESLRGEIEVTSGSAVATARLLGLTLSGNYVFATNGPEGVDVEQLDRGDRKARFTSTIRELGLASPGAVGPSFSVTKEVRTQADGEQVTTVSVQAAGTGAEAAVNAQRPSSVFTESVSVDNFRRHASGVFTSKTIITQKTHRFVVTGGGRSFRWTRRTGGRKPARHLGSFGEVTIREEFRVEAFGDPTQDKFKIPLSLAGVPSQQGEGLLEDQSGYELQGPEILQFGKDRATTKWAVTLKRRYQTASFADAARAIFAQSILDSATRSQGSSALDTELAKPDAGQVQK